MGGGDPPSCPVCDGSPLVLVAVTHPVMRRFITALLAREHGCWDARALAGDLEAAIRELDPALVLVDACSVPVCAPTAPRAVVVAPEPDPAYGRAAMRDGAHGWVARDDVADELSRAMREALGCTHAPCPHPAGSSGRELVRRSELAR